MELFVALFTVAYEGDTILGIYSTREKAQAACDDYQARSTHWGDDCGCEVAEYDLDVYAHWD